MLAGPGILSRAHELDARAKADARRQPHDAALLHTPQRQPHEGPRKDRERKKPKHAPIKEKEGSQSATRSLATHVRRRPSAAKTTARCCPTKYTTKATPRRAAQIQRTLKAKARQDQPIKANRGKPKRNEKPRHTREGAYGQQNKGATRVTK